MTLLFKNQTICLGAFSVACGEMTRQINESQKLSILAPGLGFSTRLDGHLPHRAQ